MPVNLKLQNLISFATCVLCVSTLSAQFGFNGPTLEVSPEVHLDLADNVARSHLERIDRFLQAGQWDDAIETLRRIMEENGDRMMPADGALQADETQFVRYITLRNFCQRKLVSLYRTSPEALQLYRNRVDPLVRRWYQLAVEQQDAQRLQQIVDVFFASSYGDDALYRLGEIELARGRLSAARNAWERISPWTRTSGVMSEPFHIPAGRPLWLLLRGIAWAEDWQQLEPMLSQPLAIGDWLAYPDSDLPMADVRARLTLVSILQKRDERARLELDLFRRLHPDAEGVISGRRGRYVDLLDELLTDSAGWPPLPQPPDWSTFAGNPRRDKRALRTVDVATQPLWSHQLPRRTAAMTLLNDPKRTAEDQGGLLSYHPLVMDGMAIVAAGPRIEDIQAFDLHSGQPAWPIESLAHDADTKILAGADNNTLLLGTPRFTMTANGRQLWVKLGPQATAMPEVVRQDPIEPGRLVALDLKAQKKRLLDIHLDASHWGGGWAFEGPPVCDDRRVYVMLRRRDNMHVQSHVACFDAKRGRLLWKGPKFLASAENLGGAQVMQFTHNLLTLHQGVLYCNTNLGAVAAVRAEDGTILWITRYPRLPYPDGDPNRSFHHLMRDLNPCLVSDELVIAAPADCDSIFALDAATGALVWCTPPQQMADVVHLLGVGQEHLIVSGDRLYWIDIRTGVVQDFFPAYTDDVLRGYGRGLLAGEAVYWPTRDKLYVFDQSEKRMLRQPIDLAPQGLTGGNLVLADHVLLIAAADSLTALAAYDDDLSPPER